MANDVVDFQARRMAREAEHAEYDARHKRVVAIFKLLAPVIARAQELGTIRPSLARSGRLLRNWILPGRALPMQRASDAALVIPYGTSSNASRHKITGTAQ